MSDLFDIIPEKSCAEMNLKTQTEAKALECRVVGNDGMPDMCCAAECGHWRWRDPGGTKHERRSFASQHMVPQDKSAPADLEEGWKFLFWDSNVHKILADGSAVPQAPRYWASRAIEVVLPRGCCGLAGDV